MRYYGWMQFRQVCLLACAAAAGLSCKGQPLRTEFGNPRTSGAGGTDRPRDAGAASQPRDAVGAPDDLDASNVLNADQHSVDAATAVDADDVRDSSQNPDGSRVRVLSLVLQGAPWYASQATSGMAVDSLNRVYLGDHDNVYLVDGTALSIYLSAAEAAGPSSSGSRFDDLDIGPDERLYVQTSAFFTGTGQRSGIVRSGQAHQAEWWVNTSPLDQMQKLAVIGDGYLAMVTSHGFWTISAAGAQLVYQPAQLTSTDNCTCQDLAAGPSGVFLYQSGCNGYPLLRGHADGTGVGVLYNTTITPPSAVSASNFLCSTRDPSGGFTIIVEDASDRAPRLYHVAEAVQGSTGLTWIPTAPSFAEAKASQRETFGFYFCSIATAQDGTVYFQTYHQLWKVSP